MCAILGSYRPSMFDVLLEVNEDRGTFATSIITLNGYNQSIDKYEGSVDVYNLDYPEGYYHIGHLQAPTTVEREWSDSTTHPFTSSSWLVVHNGVLNNADQLYESHGIEPNSAVDSAVIPALLQNYSEKCEAVDPNPIHYISSVLSVLEGTFAVCIVDTDSNEVYIARQGSTLFYNDKGDFSSIGGPDYHEVPEGHILQLTPKNDIKFTPVYKFKTTSPFLFL